MPSLLDLLHGLLLPPTALLLLQSAVVFGGVVVLLVDRGEPVTLDAKTVSIWAREATIRTWFSLTSVLGLGRSEPRPAPLLGPRERRSPPILLVNGHAGNRSRLRHLQRFLHARGFRWVWPVDGPHRHATLAERAAHLDRCVQRLKAATGAEQVDLIAYSTGGLAAAWYVKQMGGAAHVRRLITLGTPWRGTRLAVFGRGAAARELMYGSHVLDGLTPPPVSTVTLWSPTDPFVIPSASAAPDGVESVCLEAAGHAELLVSARAFRAIFAALQSAPTRTLDRAPTTEPAP